MFDERKIFFEYDLKYKIWRNIPRIVKTDCFGKLMQTELLERLIKNNVDIGNYILECYRQGGFAFIVISEDLPIEMYCRFSINFASKGFAHLCGGLKNTEGDYIQGILPTVVMDEKYEEFYIDSGRYSVINNRFDLNTISLQPGPHAIKAKETGIIGFTIAESIIVEPDVRFGWKYQWRAAPMVTTPIPECVLHGLIFNTDVFPKRMTIKTLQNAARICMSRNQELMNRPYPDSIRLHLAKRRNIDEF